MRNQRLQFTKGYDAEVIVAPSVAYTTQTPFATNFVNSGAEGSIGVYNADTGALITGAIPANANFFIVQKADGQLRKMSPMRFDSNLLIIKSVGVVPVTQVTTVDVYCGGDYECNSCNCCADPTVDYLFSIVDKQSSDTGMFDTWEYYTTAKKGRTIAQLLDYIRTVINSTIDGPNKDKGQAVVMSAVTKTAGATSADPDKYTFTLTGTGYFATKPFKLVSKGFCSMTITDSTPGTEGVNVFQDIREHDREGRIRDGWNTEIPGYPFVSADFGTQTQFSSPLTGVFTVWTFTQKRHEESTVIEQHVRFHLEELAVPTGSALETSLNTVFGT